MASIVSYKFHLNLPALPYQTAEPWHEYAYDEFVLSLPPDWKQVPKSEDNAFDFVSAAGAAITLSADFHEVPADKHAELADVCLSAREQSMEQLAPGKVEVLLRTIKPHSKGSGLEMAFSAELEGHTVYTWLGYVTLRKVINFALTVKASRQVAGDLFNRIVQRGYRPRLP